MATAANYYFNSPYIADAARNLASAFAPKDPDVQRQRDQNAWMFQNMKLQAANTADDRVKLDKSRAAIGQMYELQKSPILDAAGQPDQAATEKRAFELADEAMTNGGKDARVEVEDALGTLSPTFMKKKILLSIGNQYATDRLTRQLSGALDQIRVGGEVKQGLQNDEQDFELERQKQLYGLRLNELNAKAKVAAAKSGHPLLTITKQLGDTITSGIRQRERLTHSHLTDEDRFAMLSEISQDVQETRDPYASTEAIWNQHFPNARLSDAATQDVNEPSSWFNRFVSGVFGYQPTDKYLKKDVPAAAPPSATAPAAVEPRTFGGAATTPPVPSPFQNSAADETAMENASRDASRAETAALPVPDAPAQPPRNSAGRGKPKEGARQKSKSGKPMVYHSGRWEYE